MKQRKWKKTIMTLLILVASILFLRLCTNPRIRIYNFVERNEKELLAISEEWLSGEKYYFYGESEKYKGVEIEGLQKGESPIIQFYHSGWGLVPESTYYGFYYSPKDQPAAHQNADFPIISTGEDEWEWIGEGDNGGLTKKIKDNWYYYEAWY